MPRTGRHPLKNRDIKDEPIVHQKVTVTTIVHNPMLAGYWQESLEVLKLFFESLYANTSQPFDLMVFDNGSCEEVINYLLDLKKTGKIQYLILSQQNLKKTGALNFLLSSAPGEYVAYSDSDVYFLPGWLEESLKVLETFPEAGKVTALPMVGGDTSKVSKEIYNHIQEDPTITVKEGILVSDMYVHAHSLSLGLTDEIRKKRTRDRKDVLLNCNGCDAYLGGADFQFTIKRQAVLAVLPLALNDRGDYYDPIYSGILEKRLNRLGYWELSTSGYYVHHMGNRVPSLETELPWLNGRWQILDQNRTERVKKTETKYILKNRFIRRMLKHINIITYKMLYE